MKIHRIFMTRDAFSHCLQFEEKILLFSQDAISPPKLIGQLDMFKNKTGKSPTPKNAKK